jgi:superfamily II DNA/RNA helicase
MQVVELQGTYTECTILVSCREADAVLVATDAAARGIDITNIEHVVQADFAASAVDFLHRVGAG